MTDDPFLDVPSPRDATQLFEWTTGEGGPFRDFNGATREVCGVQISIAGYQNPDGTCQRWLHFHAAPVATLTSTQARELAAALQWAADEIDQLH